MTDATHLAWDILHAVWDAVGFAALVLALLGVVAVAVAQAKDLATGGWREYFTPIPQRSDAELMEAHDHDHDDYIVEQTFAPPKKRALDTSEMDLQAIQNKDARPPADHNERENGDSSE